jgi:glycogen debranching enzyme
MAKEHLISLFALQEKDGFVGHMIYWDRLKPGRLTDIFQSKPGLKNFFHSHMSALVQPPLAAQAVARVFEASGDRDFLKLMVPKLKKYYRWLAKNRDFDGDHLLTIISPFESGMDWKPTYDVALGLSEKKADWRLFMKVVGVDFRNYLNNYNLKAIYKKGYFLIKDVGFNTIYAQNLEALSRLCHEVKDPDGDEFDTLSTKVARSILQVMYDEKDAAFYDVYGKTDIKIKILTPTIFYPVVLKNLPDEVTEQVMNTHFFNSEEFETPYPIPSVAKNHSSFNPTASMYIWRGPTWIVNNWFMHQFLMEKGYRKESKKLINSIKQLIEKSGFREYYHPFTGEGYGAKDFTWAGLVVDMIQMEENDKYFKS